MEEETLYLKKIASRIGGYAGRFKHCIIEYQHKTNVISLKEAPEVALFLSSVYETGTLPKPSEQDRPFLAEKVEELIQKSLLEEMVSDSGLNTGVLQVTSRARKALYTFVPHNHSA